MSVLGRDKGYTVKYNPLPEGTPEGKGLYLTVYPESRLIIKFWRVSNKFDLLYRIHKTKTYLLLCGGHNKSDVFYVSLLKIIFV